MRSLHCEHFKSQNDHFFQIDQFIQNVNVYNIQIINPIRCFMIFQLKIHLNTGLVIFVSAEQSFIDNVSLELTATNNLRKLLLGTLQLYIL